MKTSLKLIIIACCIAFLGVQQAIADVVMHPFMLEKVTRTPGQLIQDLRFGKARVSEEQFLERLKLQGFTVKLLDELTDTNRVEVKNCDWTSATSPDIEFVGFNGNFGTHTRACVPGEKVLWLDGRPAVSLYCGNVIHSQPLPISQPQITPQKQKRKCGVVAQDIVIPQSRANNGFGFSVGNFYFYPQQNNNSSIIHHHRQIVCEQ